MTSAGTAQASRSTLRLAGGGSGARIGAVLVKLGVVSQAQLDQALRHQATTTPAVRLGQVIVQLGLASSQDIGRAVAEHLGCEFIDLEPGSIDPAAMRCLPTDYQERHNLLPIAVADGVVTIALEQFNDPFLLDEVSRRSGLRVRAVAADPEAIRTARRASIERARPHMLTDESDATIDSILGGAGVDDLQVVEDKNEDDPNLEAAGTESPIVKLVSHIIQRGVEAGASDIHIEPDGTHFRVRYRIDGDLMIGEHPARRLLPAVVSRVKILAGMDISERRLPQDGSLTVSWHGRPIDLRVSTMATRHGEKIVMRIVDRDAGTRRLEDLGLQGMLLSSFRALVREPHGLILVTGPTGSGKSTTLYSALSEIVSDVTNTSTIEDPVERRIKGVNQFQVHEGSGFTFARALRSLLRQDPDILMVGEIRDSETARLATEASLTGHLVLSTLHTNDAPSAVPRLVSMGAERYMVAATLRGVLAQRLVRRICPSCRRELELTPAQVRILETLCEPEHRPTRAFQGAGCGQCNNRGSTGRIGVFDLLIASEDWLSQILAHGSTTSMSGRSQCHSARGMLADGLAKVREGLIGLDLLLRIVSHGSDSAADPAHEPTPPDHSTQPGGLP